MPKDKSKNLSKSQKEAIANSLAGFFFDFWQKQSIKGNRVAAEGSGSLRGGHPASKAAS